MAAPRAFSSCGQWGLFSGWGAPGLLIAVASLLVELRLQGTGSAGGHYSCCGLSLAVASLLVGARAPGPASRQLQPLGL